MVSERPDLVPDEGGPEKIKAMADFYAARARNDRGELVRRDKAELEILAGHLARLDGFSQVEVITRKSGGSSSTMAPLLLVEAVGSDFYGGWKVYVAPDGTLANYIWHRGRGTERRFALSDGQYLEYGQKAIEVVGARIKEVLAAKAVQAVQV